jgi:hypothetical protein
MSGTPRYYTREGLRRAIVNKLGVPLGKSTFNKVCAPAIGGGPPVAAWSGERPLYELEPGIAWAENRLSPVRRIRGTPHDNQDTAA